MAADLTSHKPEATIRLPLMRHWLQCRNGYEPNFNHGSKCLHPAGQQCGRWGKLGDLPVLAPTADPQLYRAMHMGQIQGFPGLSPVYEPVDCDTALRLSKSGRRRTKEEKECLY